MSTRILVRYDVLTFTDLILIGAAVAVAAAALGVLIGYGLAHAAHRDGWRDAQAEHTEDLRDLHPVAPEPVHLPAPRHVARRNRRIADVMGAVIRRPVHVTASLAAPYEPLRAHTQAMREQHRLGVAYEGNTR